jgi:hypothetical protein
VIRDEESCNGAEYDKDIASLSHGSETSRHVRGFKRYCELNNVTGFHVMENFSLDIMHTLLEGLVPLINNCLLI